MRNWELKGERRRGRRSFTHLGEYALPWGDLGLHKPRVFRIGGISSGDLGRLYEVYTAHQLENLGYRVEMTKRSHDQGADLLAYSNANEAPFYVVQCKAWKQPTGIKAVQELFAAKHATSATYALLVSASGLTQDARELANRLEVIVRDLPLDIPAELDLPPAFRVLDADSVRMMHASGRIISQEKAVDIAKDWIWSRTYLPLSEQANRRWVLHQTETIESQDGSVTFVLDGTWLGPQRRHVVVLDGATGRVLSIDGQSLGF